MPAKSKAQFRFMAFCQHSDHPSAKCPKKSVAMEFTKATKHYDKLPETKAPSSPLRHKMVGE